MVSQNTIPLVVSAFHVTLSVPFSMCIKRPIQLYIHSERSVADANDEAGIVERFHRST